jgi:hypothetical protein
LRLPEPIKKNPNTGLVQSLILRFARARRFSESRPKRIEPGVGQLENGLPNVEQVHAGIWPLACQEERGGHTVVASGKWPRPQRAFERAHHLAKPAD